MKVRDVAEIVAERVGKGSGMQVDDSAERVSSGD